MICMDLLTEWKVWIQGEFIVSFFQLNSYKY